MSKRNAQRYHSQQYDSQKTSILAELRDEAGLTQTEAGEYFSFSGEKRRDTIGGWERGEKPPARKHRKRFIAYLWIELGLRHNSKRFWKLWDDVPVGEWGWSPLTKEELLDSIRRAMLFLTPFLPSHALVGREDLLNQLKQQLLDGSNVALCALHGLPGVGKTALAIALAHDHGIQEHFADGVLWASLGRTADVLAILTAWGTALRIQPSELAKLTTVADKVGRIRAAIGMRQMLLVVDDAWTVDAALTFRLGGPNCAHLLTTRQPEIARQFAHDGTLFVHELADADGFSLLQLLAPEAVKDDPDAAQELVRSVGGLPLGLVLMGNYLRSQLQSGQSRHLREALRKLRQAQMRLKLAGPQPPAEHHPSLSEGAQISLAAIIGISYQELVCVLKLA